MPKFWIFKLWPAYLFCSCPTQISWTKKQLLFFPQACMVYKHLASRSGCNFTHENIHLPKGRQLGQKKRQQCPRLKEVGLAKREHEGYRNIIPNLGVCWRGSNSSIKLIRCFFAQQLPQLMKYLLIFCFLQVTLACLMSFLGQRCVNMIQ